MTEQEIRTILSRQREYFATGATLSREFRAKQLGKLKASLQRHETELNDALQQDLGKSRMESYMCEIGLTLSELTWMQKHLRGLMREKRVPTPLSQFAARSFRSPSPYGTVLIMSPWNYPVLLTLDPLIDAIAAGNTAVVKPSGKTQCLCSGDGSSVKNDFGRMLPGGICGGDHRRQSRESGIVTAAV